MLTLAKTKLLYWIRVTFLVLWSKPRCQKHRSREGTSTIVIKPDIRVPACAECFVASGHDRMGLSDIRELHEELMFALHGWVGVVLQEVPFIGRRLLSLWLRLSGWSHRRRMRTQCPEPRVGVHRARLTRRD